VNNHKITSVLQWMLTGNPATVPIRMPSSISASLVHADSAA
jgi:hypothetical protein